MDGIDSTNSVSQQATGDFAVTNDRNLSGGQEGPTDEEITEAWTPVAEMVIQAGLLHLFPEARRIQQRTEQFNKEMLSDN